MDGQLASEIDLKQCLVIDERLYLENFDPYGGSINALLAKSIDCSTSILPQDGKRPGKYRNRCGCNNLLEVTAWLNGQGTSIHKNLAEHFAL